MAIGDQGVDPGVGEAVVQAAGVPTGVALGGDALWCAAPAPPVAPGTDDWRGDTAPGRSSRKPAEGTVFRGPWP
jgi:hypothetical protein